MKIYLWKGSTVLSRIIRTVTWSEWSHVGIVDKDSVIEADMITNRIQKVPNIFKESKDQYHEITLPFDDNQTKEILEIAEGFVDKASYDYWLMMDHLFGRKNRYTLKCFDNKNSFICSEFIVACVYKATGEMLFPERLPHTIQPWEFEIFDKNYQKKAAIG